MLEGYVLSIDAVRPYFLRDRVCNVRMSYRATTNYLAQSGGASATAGNAGRPSRMAHPRARWTSARDSRIAVSRQPGKARHQRAHNSIRGDSPWTGSASRAGRDDLMTATREDRQLRIGVLGAGQIAQAAHFEACRRGPRTPSCTRSATSPRIFAEMAALHQPRKSYRDYDAMLADPEVDAVIVADRRPIPRRGVEQGARRRQTRAGRKPLGVTVEEGEELPAGDDERPDPAGRHDEAVRPRHRFAHRFIRKRSGSCSR